MIINFWEVGLYLPSIVEKGSEVVFRVESIGSVKSLSVFKIGPGEYQIETTNNDGLIILKTDEFFTLGKIITNHWNLTHMDGAGGKERELEEILRIVEEGHTGQLTLLERIILLEHVTNQLMHMHYEIHGSSFHPLDHKK